MTSFRQFWMIFFGFTLCISATGQVHNHAPAGEKCGINYFTQQMYNNIPGAEAEAEVAGEELEDFIRTFDGNIQKDGEVYIIPVVFHVVHINGDENISAAQIHSQIDVLNEDFSADNPDLGGVHPELVDLIANVGFEFRMAQIDPDGNCTNGIVRIYDQATNNADDGIKTVAPNWPRNKYLNVWVVRTIEGSGQGTTLGYAVFPQSVNSTATAFLDGIVMRSDRVGRIGTASGNNDGTLSHEIGHWTNLCHTWGCSTESGLSTNCDVDDLIEDTPNTIGYPSTCPINGTSCGSLDNVQNFMDYSNCAVMFTPGQAQRMTSTINSFVAQRNSLWTEANLIATGVLNTPAICEANFVATGSTIICSGQTIGFEDYSFNGVEERLWSFPGGAPSSSSAISPQVAYNAPGVYPVSLTVSNALGSESVTKEGFVTVLAAGQNQLPYFEGFESFTSFEPNDQGWTSINADGDNVSWQIKNDVGYQGVKCAFVPGRQNTVGLDVEFLVSPTYDLSGISDNHYFTFQYAHARRNENSADVLRVWISRDCGDTWSIRKILNISNLPTVPNNVTGVFTPISQDQWAEVIIENIVSVFWNPEFRIRFEFESESGNNIYIDNINMTDAALNIGEIEALFDLSIYPNPGAGMINMNYELEKSMEMSIEILDMTGRVIQSVFSGMKSSGNQIETFDVSQFATGVYLVRIVADGQQIARRISVM